MARGNQLTGAWRGAAAAGTAALLAGLALAAGILADAPGLVEAAEDGAIAISTPAGNDEPLELTADGMTPAITGWLYRFPVRVRATTPLLGVSVNGESRDVPHDTQVAFETAVLLRGGSNRVTVRAFTERGEARRTFVLELDAPDGPDRTGYDFTDPNILIFRPVGARELDADPDALLRVPGGEALLFEPGRQPPVSAGLMYRFEAEVSAFSPIRWISIDGRVVARPDATWSRAVTLIPLTPDLREVAVEAATDWGTARRVFQLRLDGIGLPGTPFYLNSGGAEDDDG